MRLALLALPALAGSSCAVLQAPTSPPTVSAQEGFHASVEGIEIDAVPVRTWDANWTLFEDNLPEIGLLPVWIELRNNHRQVIDLGRVKWRLRRGSADFPALDVDDVFKLYYKRRHIRLYGVNADRESRQSMSKWLLPASRLEDSHMLKGFVFFRSDAQPPQDWTRGCVLTAHGLIPRSGARGESPPLELPLFHANP